MSGIGRIQLTDTVRKRAGNQLPDSTVRQAKRNQRMETAFDSIFKNSMIGIYVVKDGKFSFVNPKFSRTLGYHEDELLGRDSLQFVHPEDRKTVRENAVKMLKGERNDSYEFRVIRKDGSSRWIMETVIPIEYLGGRAALGNFMDITESKRTEEELRIRAQLLDTATDFILVSDFDGELLYVNEASCKAFGYRREELLGHNIHEIITQESAESLPLHDRELMENGETCFDSMHVCKNKKLIPVEIRARIYVWQGRDVILSIARDITERRLAEEALRESEEFRSSLLENSPTSVLVINPDTSIKYINPALESLTGYTSAELVGKKAPYPWWFAPDASEAISFLKKNISEGGRHLERLMQKKNGEGFWVEINTSPIRENGELKYSLSTWIDITERRLSEQALRESEEFRSSLLENAPTPMMVINQDTSIMYVNPALEALTGFSSAELVGSKAPHAFWADNEESGKVGEMKADIPGGVRGLVKVFRKKNGERFWVEITSMPIARNGAFNYTLANWVDITERKRVEEERLKLDSMKSEFISNVSHELRTPLHTIKGFTKLLLAGEVPESETQQEFMDIIDKQSEQLGMLIESLLDISRLETGRFTIQKQPVLLGEIIIEAVKTFSGLAVEKNIKIIQDIPAALPQVEADGERLRQVMSNLLGNAIKFSDAGTSITARCEVRGGEMLVRVIDQGAGISEQALPHIFERFYRAEETKDKGGTGLGLYIVKQIIESHGGNIWAESRAGGGSIFSFTLPLANSGGDSHG